ncbi:MAG: hypothetical protein WCK76_02620 [Elusimicrobiota bacterium]
MANTAPAAGGKITELLRGPGAWPAWLRGGLPALLAVAFSLWNLHRSDIGWFYADLQRFSHGGFFLAGVPFPGNAGTDITFNMPLFEIVIAAARQAGATAGHIFVALHLGVYALVFLAGCLLQGYWTGLISLAAAGLLNTGNGLIYEQMFYTFFLLLVLLFLLLKARQNTAKNTLLCGLAAGASLLVRTPLFLFPPLAVLCDWLYFRERSRAFAVRSLVLLAACYALLLPWGFLNRSLAGKFAPLDSGRTACNTITAAKGSVFTMEGDCRKLAGLGPEDSALAFYIKEWAKDPLFHALTVLRRLWAIFLMYPVLFALFLAALALDRRRDKLLIYCLPAYFILVHSLLSVEIRYFYPLRYLLLPLITGAFISRLCREEAGARCAFAEKGAAAALSLALCAVLAAEAVITAYPFRIAGAEKEDGIYARASARFPRDSMLRSLKCRELWTKGDDAGFRECLGTQIQSLEDIPAVYFLAVQDSVSPSKIPLPELDDSDRAYMLCLMVRMLREFELGRRANAETSLRAARAIFERDCNRLQGNGHNGEREAPLDRDSEPYARDRELVARMKQDSDRFWDRFVYQVLMFWPPQRMAVILSGIEKSAPLTRNLKALSSSLARDLARGKAGELGLRAGLSSWMLAPVSVRFNNKNGESSGPPVPGGNTAQELLARCRALAAGNKTEQALQACQSALYGAAAGGGKPGAALTGCDASFESYRLLKGLGREDEAAEALLWAVNNAPPGWPALREARAALKARE